MCLKEIVLKNQVHLAYFIIVCVFSLRVFMQVLKKVYIVLLHLISEVSVRDAQFLGHSLFIYQ